MSLFTQELFQLLFTLKLHNSFNTRNSHMPGCALLKTREVSIATHCPTLSSQLHDTCTNNSILFNKNFKIKKKIKMIFYILIDS